METDFHLEFVKLVSKKQIRSPELRRRAKTFPGRKIDHRYLVRRNAKEVGFLWYLAFPGNKYLKVHEMYLLKEFRGRGIGLHLIRHAERLATHHKYEGLILAAVPLDPKIDTEWLIAWYKKHGFLESDPERHIFHKSFAARYS